MTKNTYDPIHHALNEAPLYGDNKLNDDQARTIAYEIREAVQLETTRYRDMELELAAATARAALLHAHFPAFTADVHILQHGRLIVGWVNPAEQVIGLTPATEPTPRSTIAVITEWAARTLTDPAPLLSIPTANIDMADLGVDIDGIDRERYDVHVIDAAPQVFPIRAAVTPTWTIVGTQPGWLHTTVNPDVITPGISHGR